MIAFCGLSCTACPAFLATQNDDDTARKSTAEQWSKQYNVEIKPEEINCEGCRSEGGVNFSYCHVCEIRKCGQGRNLENCAHCDNYICDKLEKFFQLVPDAKTSLDAIRDNGV